MNKTITAYVVIAITVFLPAFTFATPTPKVADDVSSSATPLVDSSNTSSAQASTWSDVITIDSAGPSTGDGEQYSSATPQIGDDTSTAVSPTPTPAPATSGSSSGSSSSSSGGRMNSAYMYGCPLITTYMKYGANNNVAEVTKLQNFLKNVEKLDVDVNGTFDKKTENAVIAFQNKYSTVTMGPWGANSGTGFVYITTAKQINKIACNQPLSLSVSELAMINSFKNKRDANVSVTEIKPAATIDITPATEPTDAEIGDAPKVGEENTASVGRTSIVNKFWNFLVYLFK